MKPAKISRIIIAAIVFSLILLAVSLTLFITLYPREKLLSIITGRAESVLNRRVTAADIRYGIRGIMLKNIMIHDGRTSEDPVLAEAEEGRVKFSVSALLRKEFVITYLAVRNLNLSIQYDGRRSNLDRLIDDLTKPGEGSRGARLSSIRLENARISLKNPPEYLKPLEGAYLIDCLIELPGRKGMTISDGRIQLPQRRGTIRADLSMSSFDRDFTIRANIILSDCSLGWVYPWKKGFSLPFRSVDGRIPDLTITRKGISGRPRVASVLSNQKVVNAEGSCTVTFPKGDVFITDVHGSSGGSTAHLKSLTIDDSPGIARISVPSFNIDLRDAEGLIDLLPANLSGRIHGSFSAEHGRYTATVTSKDVSIGRGKKGISGLNETITIQNNTLRKENISVRIFDKPALVSIASLDGKFRKIVMNIDAKNCSFSPDKETKHSLDFSGVKSPVDISGRITVGELAVDSLSFTESQFFYRMAGRRISIDRFNSRLFGGAVRGTGTVDFSKNTMDIDCVIGFDRIKVQNLAALNGKLKNRFFGTARGTIDLAFRVGETINTENSVKGKMDFTVLNGKVANTGIQNGLGTWLAELRHKLKDIEFTTITGNFNIIGNAYYINSFAFTAPDIRLKMEGFVNKSLEGDLKMDLQFNKSFIADLPNPAFIQLNKYKQGAWYTIPFSIKGKDITDSKNLQRLR